MRRGLTRRQVKRSTEAYWARHNPFALPARNDGKDEERKKAKIEKAKEIERKQRGH